MSKDKKIRKDQKALDSEISSTLFDDFERFEYFFVTYWKWIIYACIGIVVCVALVGTLIVWQKNAETRVNILFANAKTKNEIVSTLSKYPDAPAALSAKLRLAKFYIQDKEFDKAFEQYAQLAKSSVPQEMLWRVDLDESYALELCGKFETAAAKFASCGSNSFIPEGYRCEANYGAGRLYLQLNNFASAEKYLNKTINAVATTQLGTMPDMAVDFWQRLAVAMINRIPVEKRTLPAMTPTLKKAVGNT